MNSTSNTPTGSNTPNKTDTKPHESGKPQDSTVRNVSDASKTTGSNDANAKTAQESTAQGKAPQAR